MSRLRNALPLLDSLRGYTRGTFTSDLSAGLTTAVMLVPQAMAYAMLAGLPPEVGLYASMLPLALYALFGSSRQLAVGPVAMVSLLVAAAVAPLAESGSAEYLGLALLLALLVGVLQLSMGLLRLGFVVNFLSHPVVSGFTSAAALIIGASQLGHLLGVKLPSSHHIHELFIEAAARLEQVNLVTLAIGAGSIAALVALKRFAPRLPRALIVVAAATLAVWGFGLHDHGVAIVGALDPGLPPLTLPPLDLASLEAVFPTALAIALIAFMESISVAKVFARRHKYELDANQELVALGAANLGAAFTGGYAVTGGFSRTAVNDQAGARTNVAALVTAGAVALTALLLTPLFFYLPKAALAAIIVTAVAGLVDLHEVKHLWKVKKSDLIFLGLTFVSTLTLGIEPGILIGVAASIGWLVVRTTRPHTAVLGRLPGTPHFRNVKNYPHAERTPGVLVLRMDARLYFGNIAHFKRILADELGERRERAERGEASCATVVIDASAMNDLDSSGDSALEDLRADLAARDIDLLFASVKRPVYDVMVRSGFAARLGPDRFFYDVDEAVTWAAARSCAAA